MSNAIQGSAHEAEEVIAGLLRLAKQSMVEQFFNRDPRVVKAKQWLAARDLQFATSGHLKSLGGRKVFA